MDESKPAYDKAIKLLAIREHSQAELKRKLKTFAPKIIEQVLTQLQQQDYQSDERFLEILIRSRINSGKGYLLIKQELSQHQINNELIEQTLEAIDDKQWQDHCYQVWQKKFVKPSSLIAEESHQDTVEEDEKTNYQQKTKERFKQQSFLSQRGFRSQDWKAFLK